MARKRKVTPELVTKDPEFYAYFDPETDKVFLVTNVLHDTHTHYAKITQDQHREICSGKVQFHECIIDRQFGLEGRIEHKLITKQIYDEFQFKNKSLIWINSEVDDPEFLIDYGNDAWTFTVTDKGRNILEGAMYDSTLVFFVTLETDFDFLVRTFYIRLHDVLKAGQIVYAFESNFEKDITRLSITTKKFFNNYGLKIND